MSKSKKIKNETINTTDTVIAAEVEKEDINNTTIAAEEKEDMKDSTIAAAKVGVVNVDKLNVRKGASLKDDVVKVINKNDEVNIIGVEGDFYKINDGFVMKKFIDER